MEDIYRKSFKDGGLTYGQLIIMYRHEQKRREQEFRMMAAMHGVKLKDNKGPTMNTNQHAEVTTNSNSSNDVLFRDPSEYEHMSQEEKEVLTNKMMGFWKRWADTDPVGGKKPKKC